MNEKIEDKNSLTKSMASVDKNVDAALSYIKDLKEQIVEHNLLVHELTQDKYERVRYLSLVNNQLESKYAAARKSIIEYREKVEKLEIAIMHLHKQIEELEERLKKSTGETGETGIDRRQVNESIGSLFKFYKWFTNDTPEGEGRMMKLTGRILGHFDNRVIVICFMDKYAVERQEGTIIAVRPYQQGTKRVPGFYYY